MPGSAYYSHEDHCWYVPVASELWMLAENDELEPVEPVRVELKDGQLVITRLELNAPTAPSAG